MSRTALTVVGGTVKGKIARPRKFADPERREKVLGYLAMGVPRNHAAQACGSSDDALMAEMHRSADFADAVKEAEGKAVSVAIGLIQKAAASGQWQAAAWFLERRYPQMYARRFIADAAPGTTVKFTLDISGEAQDDAVTVIDG